MEPYSNVRFLKTHCKDGWFQLWEKFPFLEQGSKAQKAMLWLYSTKSHLSGALPPKLNHTEQTQIFSEIDYMEHARYNKSYLFPWFLMPVIRIVISRFLQIFLKISASIAFRGHSASFCTIILSFMIFCISRSTLLSIESVMIVRMRATLLQSPIFIW